MLTKIPNTQVKLIDEEAIRKEIYTTAYLMSRNRKWDLTEEEFIIDENLNFTHATWKGVFCKGGDTVIATVEIINQYIEECNKSEEKRDLSFIHIIED